MRKEQKQDKKGFPMWHCQKSGTILKEIHGSSYRYFGSVFMFVVDYE